jgi:hypothetical protein
MRRLFSTIALLVFVSMTFAKTMPYTRVVDFSAADTLDIYFSGTSALAIPAPSNSGWSLWIMNGVTMNCDDVDVIVWPMDEAGNVSTNSANSTTLWTALDLSDSTTIEHKALGTLDRCAGVKVVFVPTSGSGTARIKLFMDTE